MGRPHSGSSPSVEDVNDERPGWRRCHRRRCGAQPERDLDLFGGFGLVESVVLVRDTTLVYGLAGLTCGLATAGCATTRIVAFPHLSDDVGDWWEPLGVVSIAAETVVVAAALGGPAAANPSRVVTCSRRVLSA